jgi:hypothetical protein
MKMRGKQQENRTGKKGKLLGQMREKHELLLRKRRYFFNGRRCLFKQFCVEAAQKYPVC